MTGSPETMTIDINRWVAKAKGRTRLLAVEFIQDLNEAVVLATPVGRTGFLRASWRASINTPPAPSGPGSIAQMNLVGAQIQVGQTYYAVNGANYAVFVEYGTRPHDIRPVRKRALHWEDRARMPHFAQLVKHPGTAPQPFVRGTLLRADVIAEAAARRVAALA